MPVDIHQASSGAEIEAVRRLFKDYQHELSVDLCFQGFDHELVSLPGDYAPPRGRLLVARVAAALAGCVALRPIDAEICEMKRLYVVPEHRASGVGLQLVRAVISDAKQIGYRRICLDTLPTMSRAQQMYERLGFHDIPPYRHNPIAGARYLGLDIEHE